MNGNDVETIMQSKWSLSLSLCIYDPDRVSSPPLSTALPVGPMAATLRLRDHHRYSRAPPPTPIATAKGSRSEAVDDRVLSEYLEKSLRVPDLALPESPFEAKSPARIPSEIDVSSLLSRDEASVRRLLASAADLGAIRIDGGDVVSGEEIRSVIEVAGAVFGMAAEERKELDRYFMWRDASREEFYWFRPVGSEAETVLQQVCPDTYRTFREKLENIALKLEKVAECIAQILSKHLRNQRHTERIGKRESILCLRKYNSLHVRGSRNKFNDGEDFPYYALSLHLSGDYHEFNVRSAEDSVSFSMPTGSIAVTIRRQLQEWCNGEFKSAIGEPILEEKSDGLRPSFSLEFMCSPLALDHELNRIPKAISIADQLLIVLVLAFLYRLFA